MAAQGPLSQPGLSREVVTPPVRVPVQRSGLSWLHTVQADAAKLKPALPQFIAEAAPASRVIPYADGLDYGIGIDSPSGTALNVAVTGGPSQIPNAAGAAVAYTMNELTSEEDLQTALGISVEANGGIGLFSASARMNYAQSCQINSSSVFVLVNIEVTNAFTMIVQPGISQAAAALLANGDNTAFQQQYGDMFVRGLQTGGSFFGVVEIETYSETDKQSVSASVSGAYGPFSASGSFSNSFQQTLSNRNVKATCYIEGGNIPDPLPTNLASLATAASAWPQTVATKAVPYAALLDGYGVLPLPNPPNYIDLQQQQDVLNQCSLWRNQDMTTLNDIAYIKTYPEQFVNPNTAQLNQWENEITQDLNTIAAAASNALNNPAQAVLPQLLLPPPVQLPERIDVQFVTIPNWQFYEDVDVHAVDGAGHILYPTAADLGLLVSMQFTAPIEYGDIQSMSPPAGSSVPVGTTVTIVCGNERDD